MDRLIRNKFESYLDKSLYGPQWLRKSSIAEIVEEAIHFRNGRLYELYAYSIMSNHVHMVFQHIEHKSKIKSTDHLLLKDFPVTKILADLKKFTAGKCNRRLGRRGHFWQAENFDRLIRNNKELENCIRYTLNNPVKAGLVEYWDNWPHSYCKPEFFDSI
ncbi:transposase [Rhodohalobacter sp. SW132]|uniref:transposase n=1 Tax=Rhodohalobacter sp. SW132 TaxID=2293433 RepID=UPI0011C05C29|nr:transposase [Rhodohalobacter sp. SW132]